MISKPSDRSATPLDGTAGERAGQGAWRGRAVLAAVLLAAAWTYVPWRRAAFDKLISDFLPLLPRDRSFVDGLAVMFEYYKDDGRFQPIYMAELALEWTVFGSNARAWQVWSFVLVAASAVVAFALFRRLRIAPVPAAVGACLVVASQAPMMTIIMTHWVAEPTSTLFMLGAAHLAVSYPRARRPVATAVGIGALALLSIWSKETTVAAVPFLVLLALSRDAAGRWRLPGVDRQAIGLVVVVGAFVALAAAPILLARLNAPGGSYGAQYTLATLRGGHRHLIPVAEIMFLPGSKRHLHPANLLAIATGLLCLYALLRPPRDRDRLLGLAVAASLPIGGFLIYVPWVALDAWYGFPYLIGTGLMLAFGLDRLRELSRAGYAAALALSAAAAVVVLHETAGTARRWAASRLAEESVVRWVGLAGDVESLVVAMPAFDGGVPRAWSRFQRAIIGRAPLTHTLRCNDALQLLREAGDRVVVVTDAQRCPEIAASGIPPVAAFEEPYVRPSGLGLERSSIRMQIRRGVGAGEAGR